ncbi:MAG: zf-HC2 domain-containing protein [Isosphaeraceae bacterium]|nr:zf-HC2 domain-containing protein [Isosphaeraceae bacterium]
MPRPRIWFSTSCRWIQSRLPLLVGDDLLSADRRRVERHLIHCVDCRARGQALDHAISRLRESSLVPAISNSSSIWPGLERQIQASRHEPSRSVWGIAIVGLAASLFLCLGLWFVAQSNSRRDSVVENSSKPRPALPPEETAGLASARPDRSTSPTPKDPGASSSSDPQRSY